MTKCAAPTGYVADATDCDDTSPDAHPGATEVWYDGKDEGCDGGDDDDQDRDGVDYPTDCDDTDPRVQSGCSDTGDTSDTDTDSAGDTDSDTDGGTDTDSGTDTDTDGGDSGDTDTGSDTDGDTDTDHTGDTDVAETGGAEDSDATAEDKGCGGCDSSPSSAHWLALFGATALTYRRRRR